MPMEESVGFGPTELLHSPVFKTGALNQTRPTFHMATPMGFEPTTSSVTG